MNVIETDYKRLQALVEKQVGRVMRTPRDFEFLAVCIYNLTKNQISSTTLKRFWGYLKEGEKQTPRIYTLDLLSRMAGYKDWDSFVNAVPEQQESEFMNNECLSAESLFRGDRLRLLWAPDRNVTIQYEGLSMFTVIESVNSKLSQGDTFHCNHFINGEPLHLYCLVHEGGAPTNYVCGRINGITFTKL